MGNDIKSDVRNRAEQKDDGYIGMATPFEPFVSHYDE